MMSFPNRAVSRQAIRMTAAAMFAYLVTGMIGFHHGYWAVITCLVVIQGSVGATINAGLARMAGTAAGAAAGGIGALLLHLQPAIPEWAVLLLVVAPLALLASWRTIFRLAPLTGALVLLLAGSGSMGFALQRVAEIALGTVIGVVFSLFVLPDRATASLIERSAAILELLGAFSVILLGDPQPQEHERISGQLGGSFAQLQNDMKEVAQERSAHLLRSDVFAERLTRHLQRLRTDVAMLGRVVAHSPDRRVYGEIAERLKTLFLHNAAILRHREAPAEADLHHLHFTEAPDTPVGFALLTLQNELKALHETLQQWIDPPA